MNLKVEMNYGLDVQMQGTGRIGVQALNMSIHVEPGMKNLLVDSTGTQISPLRGSDAGRHWDDWRQGLLVIDS